METGSKPAFQGVQALRFVAALMVVITHATFYSSERLAASGGFWWEGGRGVNVFFVISGFVMVVSSAPLRGAANGWRVFLARRLIRIVPMYWVATTIKLVAMLTIPAVVLHSKLDPWHVVSSYAFIPTINAEGEFKPLLAVGWTLYFEMFFYALFAWALALKAPLYAFMGIVLGAFSLLSPLRHPESPSSMFFDPVVLQFYAGMAVAAAMQKADTVRALAIRYPIAPAALSLVGLGLLISPMTTQAIPEALKTGVPATLVVLGVALLEPMVNGRIPKSLLFLGDASYAIYLFHPLVVPLVPVIMRVSHVDNQAICLMSSITIALGVGAGVHLVLEQPLSRCLKAWLRRRAGSPSPILVSVK